MPEESQNERSFLEERKAEYLAELRRREPELVAKFLKVTAAIEAFDSMESEAPQVAEVASGEYAGISKPLDAIEAFLDKEGAPASRETIANALEMGEWGKDRVKRPKWSLMSMLDYYLGLQDKSEAPKSTSEPRIKEVNGLVGKVEWPDEMFTQAGRGGE